MKKNTIPTGSRAFFCGMEGFQPKDTDQIVLVDNPRGFRLVRQTTSGSRCTFEVLSGHKQEHIAHALTKAPAMTVVRFLTPAYAEHIGLTIAELETLRPLLARLDKKHQYAAVIFDAYVSNGTFTLTDEQRKEAFAVYQSARKEDPCLLE